MEEEIVFRVYADVCALEASTEVNVVISKEGLKFYDDSGEEFNGKGIQIYGRRGKRIYGDELEAIVKDFLL